MLSAKSSKLAPPGVSTCLQFGWNGGSAGITG